MGKLQLLSNSVTSDFSSKNDFIHGALVCTFCAINNPQTQWLRWYALPVCSVSGGLAGVWLTSRGIGHPACVLLSWGEPLLRLAPITVATGGEALSPLLWRSRQDRVGDRQPWGGECTLSTRRKERAKIYSLASLISSTCVA